VHECLLGGRPQDVNFDVLSANPPLMDIWTTLDTGAPHAMALSRARQGEVGWCAPEVMRRAALSRLNESAGEELAACLNELRAAYDLSVQQGARFWSLRIACSIHEVSSSRSTERSWSRKQLIELLIQIDDGSMQPDLVKARQLATSCGPTGQMN
jgi:hypothetical protein